MQVVCGVFQLNLFDSKSVYPRKHILCRVSRSPFEARMTCEIGAGRIGRNGTGGKQKGRVEGNFNQGKSVSKEACKVYLETLDVEDLSRGSVRQGRKAKLKIDAPALEYSFSSALQSSEEPGETLKQRGSFKRWQ